MANEQPAGGGVLTPPTFGKFGRFEVVSAATFQSSGAFMFLYARGGGGKTTLAASLHASDQDSPVVIFDAEGGSKVVNDIPDVQVIPVKTWKDLDDLEDQIKRTPVLPWKTIILDNESEFCQLCVNAVTGNEEDQVTQPEWGSVQRKMLAHVRFYRDLAAQRGINVIMICWDVTERDETNKLVAKLNFIPSLQKSLPGVVDIIGYIQGIDNDPDHRILDFSFSTKTDAKFRRNTSDAARSIPLKLVYGLDNLPLIDIMNSLKRGEKFPADKYQVQRSGRPATSTPSA